MLGKLCAICLWKYVLVAFLLNGWREDTVHSISMEYGYGRHGRHFPLALSIVCVYNYKTHMSVDSRQRARRRKALSAQGATHPHPQAVTDPLFRDSAFFDPNDLVQVKYEMLRSVQQEGRAVVEAAQAFGLSRPVFYVTQELFQREGLPGLLPRKRGPKRPHKLTDEAMAVLVQAVQEAGRMLKGEELASLLAQRCGIEAHPRSILRRLRP